MDTYLSGHGQYYTEYHICWITKYRHPVLTTAIRRYLNKLLPKIMETMPGCEIVEINILGDHVHTVVIIPPKYAVKDVIGRLKGISSSKLKEKFDVSESVWSPGYFVKTVGVPEEKILSYIRNQ
jgi:putative transposase